MSDSRTSPWFSFAEFRRLLALMLPLYIGNLMQLGMGVTDTIAAGRAGAGDLAAVGLATSLVFPIMVGIGTILTIATPMISRLRGAGCVGKAGLVLNNTKTLALLLLAAEWLLLYAGSFVFPLVTDDPAIARTARLYIWFIMLGIPANLLFRVAQAHFEGFGQTRPAMLFSMVGVIINIPLNYFFVFGKCGFPRLGGAGCGLASAIIIWVMALGMTGLLLGSSQHRARTKQWLHFRRPAKKLFWDIFRLGFPLGLAAMCEMSFFAVVTFIVAPLGTLAVAAQQVSINVSGMVFMLPLSVGVAASIRAAYHYGAGNAYRFDALVHTAVFTMLGGVFLLFSGTILFREQIVACYTADADIAALAAELLFFCAVYQFSDGFQALLSGLLRACQDTAVITWTCICSYWLVGFPLSCILIHTDWIVPAMGPSGAWVSFIVSLTLTAVVLGYRYRCTRRRLFETR